MIKKILKFTCWPFIKIMNWLKSGLPEGKVKKNLPKKEKPLKLQKEVPIVEPEKIVCNTHSRYKKSCPTCNKAKNG
jgi:hypothetical protein